MKPFKEALRDGFKHLIDLPQSLYEYYHGEGITEVDTEGIYVYSFGEHKEFELRIEPYGEEGQYIVALYKNNIPLTQKLLIWESKNKTKIEQ